MSVQNPDKPITKQDLADFYGEILPYMGGMPEVLANKFARGDLYDTNEKMIGKWIDGKPLYQKTIEFSTPLEMSWNSQYCVSGELSNSYLDNMDTIVKMEGVGTTNRNSPQKVTASMSIERESSFAYLCCAVSLIDGLRLDKLVIQYTKTTDQANSFNIGSDTDYSTDEKIVGTWIDGSYLYQLTINGTVSNGSEVSIPSNITVRSIEGTGIEQNGSGIPLYYSKDGNNYFTCWINHSSSKIVMEMSTGRSNVNTTLTIRYTKTS